MLYLVVHDDEDFYFEARDFAHAVDLWTEHVKDLWGDDYEESDQPDSVQLVDSQGVLNFPTWLSDPDSIISVKLADADPPKPRLMFEMTPNGIKVSCGDQWGMIRINLAPGGVPDQVFNIDCMVALVP